HRARGQVAFLRELAAGNRAAPRTATGRADGDTRGRSGRRAADRPAARPGGALGGHPAVRRRNGARSDRPGRRRTQGRALRSRARRVGPDRLRRSDPPDEPAHAHRKPAGRPAARSAGCRPGRRRPRPVVHRRGAGELLDLAAQQARVLGAPLEARRHLAVALDLVADAPTVARLTELAARAALGSGAATDSASLALRAEAAYREAGRPLEAARAL